MSDLTDIRRVALNYLARRDHSKQELKQKLAAKNFCEKDIEIILNECIDKKFLCEIRFVENYIQYRRNKGFGPLHIRTELLNRGISEKIIQEFLYIETIDWLKEIKKVWQKRFKNKKPDDFKTRAQHMRFLAQRGFTQDQIHWIFNDFLPIMSFSDE